MDDEQLRSRLHAADPMLDGVPTEPADSPSARSLLEAIVHTDTTPRPDLDRDDDRGRVTTHEPRRRRWTVAALATAAAVAIAVAGAAAAGVFDGSESDVADPGPSVDDEPTVLELSGGETDPMMMSCIAIDSTIIAQSPVAFRGVVDTIEGDVVTLTVDEWYQGGDADVVTISAPLGMEALIGGIAFEPGQAYLVAAENGVVSYCGMSGPATPELQQLYDGAFAG